MGRRIFNLPLYCELEREKERIQKAKEEKRKENIKKLFRQSKLGKRFSQCSLENFTVVEGVEKAFRATKELVDSFPPPRGEGKVGKDGFPAKFRK